MRNYVRKPGRYKFSDAMNRQYALRRVARAEMQERVEQSRLDTHKAEASNMK